VIRQRLASLDPASHTLADESAAIFKDVIDGAVNPVGTADRIAHYAVRACIGLFFVSLLFFLAFAIGRFCGVT
jgi:hypothetical protein